MIDLITYRVRAWMYIHFGWPALSAEDKIEFRGHWRRSRLNAKMATCDHYLDDKDVCRFCGAQFTRVK